jgi:hypothetical protein
MQAKEYNVPSARGLSGSSIRFNFLPHKNGGERIRSILETQVSHIYILPQLAKFNPNSHDFFTWPPLKEPDRSWMHSTRRLW